MLLQVLMIYDINDNAFKVNPFIHACSILNFKIKQLKHLINPQHVTSILHNHMCLNSVADLENYFLWRLGQQEFRENIK